MYKGTSYITLRSHARRLRNFNHPLSHLFYQTELVLSLAHLDPSFNNTYEAKRRSRAVSQVQF
jgi:hypothetical protein